VRSQQHAVHAYLSVLVFLSPSQATDDVESVDLDG
jgi:hypothetical protein